MHLLLLLLLLYIIIAITTGIATGGIFREVSFSLPLSPLFFSFVSVDAFLLKKGKKSVLSRVTTRRRRRRRETMENKKRWLLLALSTVECLLCTGVTFGLSALTIALKRDGQFSELCYDDDNDDDDECNAQKLKFNAMYTAGTVSVPLSMMFWGSLIDKKGVKFTRAVSLCLFTVGCVLFAESDSKRFDGFVAACVFLGAGGAGFFLSHFQFCEHWRHTKYFGMSHSVTNMAFDSSTVTFYAFEAIHKAGVCSVRQLFYGLAGISVAFIISTNKYVWGAYLDPPLSNDDDCDDGKNDSMMENGVEDDFDNAQDNSRAKKALEYGGAPLTRMKFTEQVRTPFFWTIAAWSLGSIYRSMFILGSIFEQMLYNNDGRSTKDANSYVRLFNALILMSTFLTPLFGLFVDKFGLAPGFSLVNVLGIISYAGVLWNHDEVSLAIAFLAFGCFRAWNYSCLTIYVQGVFGNATFGQLYGIGIGTFAVISGCMQYPSMHLVLKEGDGDFLVVDLLMICIGVILFAFPAWIRKNGVFGGHGS